jgi:dienelactone hydrolase
MPLLANPDRMRGIGHAALDMLRAEPRTDPDRIAAIGYGTGGAVGPEGMGLSDVERRRADALAELGYVALAFDLLGVTQIAPAVKRCRRTSASTSGSRSGSAISDEYCRARLFPTRSSLAVWESRSARSA